MTKPSLRVGTALFCAAFAALIVHRTLAQSAGCPCSIWPSSAVPANAALTDGQPIEVGVKFRSDVDGFVTAIRFFKGVQNSGTHVGHLWSASGTLLGEATFTSETASGWQEVQVSPPVAVVANTTYVASYYAESGFFALNTGFFAATGVDTPPLHALRSGVDGPNGVFRYGLSGFPTQGVSNNFWVDVVLQTNLGPDVSPGVASVVPVGGATGVATASTARATFTEAIDPATINASTFELRDETGAALSGVVTYDASSRTATFGTTAGLLPQSVYTATVTGGPDGVRDLAGNALTSDFVWSFTTGTPTPPADDGPGGPILIISSSSNPFSRYYAEILRTEGLNEFSASDMSLITPALLGAHDVVILGEIPLTSGQAAMLGDYVSAGGNLVAMRPDKQLAGLLGLTSQSTTLSDAYLQINTSAQPGAGIVSDTIQFHGAADRYTVNGAVTIARLFSDAVTATTSPAVTVAGVGQNGGHAAAFTYDLARSIVYTRQGNPAWSGRERDGNGPIRSDDLFFGAAAGDVRADWVDLNKVAIPQADEQQRLLANLVLYLNRERKPLPRFWYLPRSLKAAIVMTGDDHGNGGTVGRFNQYKGLSAPGCSVDDWECIRSTSYIYPNTTGMDNAVSTGFVNDGFEVALHVSSNCQNWAPGSLATFYSSQIAQFRAARPGVPPLLSNRTHCVTWSDYVSQPKIERANGIRFDTNYYYFPAAWVQNRPGHFTGSAMPMRFADLDGTTIDVYQAATQMNDEANQSYPFTVDTLLDRALGPLGYYGVFTACHHTDFATIQQSDTTIASAIARNVPVVSAKQMLEWLDGRNGSSFGSIAWSPGALTFTIDASPAARGLTAMVPTQAKGGALIGLTRDGVPVGTDPRTVKGVEYAFFPASSGSYVATYVVDVAPPVISGVTATPGLGNTAVIAWTTNEAADSGVDVGTSPLSLNPEPGNPLPVTSHTVTLAGLSPFTTYYFRATSTDVAGNSATSAVGSFTMPPTLFGATDTTVADFAAGTLDGREYIAETADGEIILSPLAGSEFSGTTLPPDWSTTAWAPGGAATVSGGVLTVNGARAGTIASYPAGRSLEFVATFTGAPFQHAGFAVTLDDAPWAMFSTAAGGGLFARTSSTSSGSSTTLSSSLLGSPHRFRIDWTPAGATYYVDGTVVASHATAINVPLRPIVSDLAAGTGVVTVGWMRMSPYASPGTFLSRVFDAGAAVNWGPLWWTAQLPSGTGAAFLVRHGDTAAPDATWTPFAPIAGSGSAIGGSSRYLQYRVDLASSVPRSTPSVEQVTIGYSEIQPNNAPVASDDSFGGMQDTVLTAAAPGVLANDTDADGDALSATLVSGPSHGTLALQLDGGFTYTPAGGFFGADAFTYQVSDGHDSTVATVSIAIAAANRLPIATADAYATNEDTPLTVSAPGVLANDTDEDGDALSAVLVSGPTHGTLSLEADGAFTYTPAADFFGADAFTYTVNDGGGASSPATVSIAVASTNDLPTATADTYATNEDTPLTVSAPGVLANDTDVDGDALSAVLVSGPAHGTLALQPDGAFIYTPAADFFGADAFTYTVNDGGGASSPATVSIAVASTNDLPTATADTYATNEDTPLTVGAPGVLANDTDVDGDALSAVLVTGPTHGTLALQAGWRVHLHAGR